jgi:hypothetical protein
MKTGYWRVLVGVGLILAGVLALLQAVGILPYGGFFGGLMMAGLFGIGGLAFLAVLVQKPSGNWWAVIPGVVLLTLSSMILLGQIAPEFIVSFGGGFFLAGISLAFWLVFAITPENWWAVIPGGVLLSLAGVTVVEHVKALEAGGILFIGIGLTFALLGLIRVNGKRMDWPWIPALVLLVLGILVSFATARLVQYLLPAGLLIAGLFILIRSFTRD